MPLRWLLTGHHINVRCACAGQTTCPERDQKTAPSRACGLLVGWPGICGRTIVQCRLAYTLPNRAYCRGHKTHTQTLLLGGSHRTHFCVAYIKKSTSYLTPPHLTSHPGRSQAQSVVFSVPADRATSVCHTSATAHALSPPHTHTHTHGARDANGPRPMGLRGCPATQRPTERGRVGDTFEACMRRRAEPQNNTLEPPHRTPNHGAVPLSPPRTRTLSSSDVAAWPRGWAGRVVALVAHTGDTSTPALKRAYTARQWNQ